MKEEEIRPSQLMSEELRLRKEDIQTLLTRHGEFVEVPCPACSGRGTVFKFEKDGFRFVQCNTCESLYINPRPSFDLLKDYYTYSKSIRYWNEYIFPASEEIRRTQIFKPRVQKVIELCIKHGVERNTLVDVGAGFGTFCEVVKQLEFFRDVIAVEPGSGLAETCRKKGITTLAQPIEDVTMAEVDVITNFELIEHLFAPQEFLKACHRVLRQDGLLILTTPNIKGFDLAVLQELSDNIAGPNHLNYFHPDSLSGLLEECGFETVEMITPGKLDAEIVRTKILSGELNTAINPFLKTILIDAWERIGSKFQDFLAEAGLSSHLWMVSKKRVQK